MSTLPSLVVPTAVRAVTRVMSLPLGPSSSSSVVRATCPRRNSRGPPPRANSTSVQVSPEREDSCPFWAIIWSKAIL